MKPLPELCRLMEQCGEMQDFNRLCHLAVLMMEVEHIDCGAMVEVGVYKGNMAAFMAALTKHPLYLYDSFNGLPKPGPNDSETPPFVEGGLKCGMGEVDATFLRAGLPLPESIVAMPVEKLVPADLPTPIILAHIDVDLYEPTLAALKLVFGRMLSGSGTIVVDDYLHPQLPGVKKAVDEFFGEGYRHLHTHRSFLHAWIYV